MSLRNNPYIQKRREEVARTEFKQLAKNLHHLTSTKNIPGLLITTPLSYFAKAFIILHFSEKNQLPSTLTWRLSWQLRSKKHTNGDHLTKSQLLLTNESKLSHIFRNLIHMKVGAPCDKVTTNQGCCCSINIFCIQSVQILV